MNTRPKFPPVIFTDDGWILSATEPPVTFEDLKEKVVGSYAGTGGALGWSIGDHEVYHYETQVGEMFGENDGGLDESAPSYVHSGTPGVEKRIAANVRALIESSGGPLTALAGLCREAGVPFFPRVRMNSHYVIDPAHPGYGRFRREHPEWLIGRPGEQLPEGSVEWGIRTGKNYAFPEVRAYMARIIFEVFERFDVDGVELDFMRHPGFFRMEEAYANCYLMTDFVRQVRDRLHEVGRERGKTMQLIVRVPPTLADSARTGLDVAAWISEGLVDVVVVGGGFIPFEAKVKEVVDVAKGTQCLVYGCIEATRSIDEKLLRALASLWWADGADGVYLYNFYTMSADWNQRTFQDLCDPANLAHLDKRYETSATGPFSPVGGHGSGFRYAMPLTQVPVKLQPGYSGRGPLIGLRITDDVDAAAAEGVLGPCQLALHLDRIDKDDTLVVRLNGQALDFSSSRVQDGWKRMNVSPQFWMRYPTYPVEATEPGISVEFDIMSPPLKQGYNELEVHLAPAGTARREPVVLTCAAVTIHYR